MTDTIDAPTPADPEPRTDPVPQTELVVRVGCPHCADVLHGGPVRN